MNKRMLFVIFAVVSLTGCSDRGLSTASVRGNVEFDGKPLSTGLVFFVPQRGRMGRGEIQEDGSFEISTYKADSGDGAILGQTLIGVVSTFADNSEKKMNRYDQIYGGPKGSLIPEVFNSPEDSGLKYDVKAGTNDIRINLSSDGTGTIEKQ